MKKFVFAVTIIVLTFQGASFSIGFNEFCSVIMRSTFKILGPNSLGTVIILGRPNAKIPGSGNFILVTATHVLEAIPTDVATLSLRIKSGDDYKLILVPVQIRLKGAPLWVKHPQVDVAAMNVTLPKMADVTVCSTELLATDELIKRYEIHPGDELLVLGFPLGVESNSSGFPVLRSARIANFPIVPIASYPTFLLDITVFPGNSGGPVILDTRNRVYDGTLHPGSVNLVMGIVSQELVNTERINSISETILKQHRLSLAVAVHAKFIKEIIELLPVPE